MIHLSVLLPESTSCDDSERFCKSLRSELSSLAAGTEVRDLSDVAIEVSLLPEPCLAELNSPHSVTLSNTVETRVNACEGAILILLRSPALPEDSARIASNLATTIGEVGISDSEKDLEQRQPAATKAHPVVARSQTWLLTLVCAEADSWSILHKQRVRNPGVTRPNPWRAYRESLAGERSSRSPALRVPAATRQTTPPNREEPSDAHLHSIEEQPAGHRKQVSVWGAALGLLLVVGGPLSWAALNGSLLTDNLSASETAATESETSPQNDKSRPAPKTTAKAKSQTARPYETESRGSRTDLASVAPKETEASSGFAGPVSLADEAIEARLRRDAAFLASDDLEGRGARTRGLELAAEYLAEQFAATGLNTKHFDGAPFQEFELFSIGGDSPVQQLTFNSPEGQARRLKPDQDFTSLVLSRKTKLNVPVVFAGYGISAPEVAYDDYQGLDVTGKAVVVLRHAPPMFDNIADDLAKHSYVRTKIANASAHGAAAVLLCTDLPAVPRESAGTDTDAEQLLRVELRLDDGVRPIPVVHCRREMLKTLLSELCEFDLDATETSIRRTGKADSRDFDGLSLAGHVSQLRRGRTLKNVLATLQPAAPINEETIVVGAHYDHLGRGGWGSLTLGANHEIHNGADDNASGTAVMLEVARQLTACSEELQRQVLFIGFSAEELGLIGSRKYIEQPLIPIDQTIAMLNLDMVGRLRNDRLTVYGTGSSKLWNPMLDVATAGNALTLIRKPSGYGPSDHASFYEAGVPVLHFFTGFHPQYHRPEDDIQHLNVAGMRRIATLVVDLLKQLAQAEQRPPRTLAGDSSGLLGSSVSFDSLLTSPSRASKPVLGVVPANRGSDREGVLVERTLKQSVADLYGFRSGDVIVRIGDDRVDTVDELVTRVGKLSRGDRLPIELVRNGIRLEVQVQF